jgi:hypothetical protein
MAASHARSFQGATAVLALACAALGACADVDDRPASWSYIHATIIEPNCTTSNCHTDISKVAGISFDDPDESYETLAGVACGGGTASNYVVAGAPELSQLMYLLRGDEVPVMPPDVPLPDTEVEIIERWIQGGASCD